MLTALARLSPSSARSLRLFGTVLGGRVLQNALILAAFVLLPPIFQLDNYRDNFHWPPGEPPSISSLYKTWDAQHYLYLSQHRYEAGHPSVGFHPLWPWLIRLGDVLLFGHTLVAALVLAALLSAGAAVCFQRLAERHVGEPAASLALLLLMAQPAAFYFGLPYAESLLLFSSLLVVDSLERGQLLQAGLFAFFVPLTRPPGAFIVFPVVTAVLLRWRADRRLPRFGVLAVMLPLLGVLVHACLMFWQTGDPLASVHIQSSYFGQGSLQRLVDPVAVARDLVNVAGLHTPRTSLIDRAFFVAFVLTLPAIFRLGAVQFAYALPMGLFTGVAQGGFTCFIRYMAVVFPVFLVWGRTLASPRAAWLRPLVIAALFALQVLLLVLHSNNYYVAA